MSGKKILNFKEKRILENKKTDSRLSVFLLKFDFKMNNQPKLLTLSVQ